MEKRLQGAGSQVTPGTASTSQQADNTGDNQGSQAVSAYTSQPLLATSRSTMLSQGYVGLWTIYTHLLAT